MSWQRLSDRQENTWRTCKSSHQRGCRHFLKLYDSPRCRFNTSCCPFFEKTPSYCKEIDRSYHSRLLLWVNRSTLKPHKGTSAFVYVSSGTRSLTCRCLTRMLGTQRNCDLHQFKWPLKGYNLRAPLWVPTARIFCTGSKAMDDGW